MAIMNQVMVEAYRLAERELHVRSAGGTQASTVEAIAQTSTTTSSAPTTTTSQSSGGGGPTSSPLLFFVALGFGVVFTNLWIIVGVKYCFRYNARNRAIRNGEEVDPIHLENMPARPHRRRREKKLMTMDEVNERFPLTKYKNWVAIRASEGLPTAGGVTGSPSRAGSVRDVDGVTMPSSPVETKHSVNTRPATAASDVEVTVTPATNNQGGAFDNERKSLEGTVAEKAKATTRVEETNGLEEVPTTATALGKHATITSVDDDDDDDDHIHTAVPPELLTNPGDSCAICIDTLEDDDDIRGLTCGHAFHAGCLDPWLTSRRACCPLCKADYYTPKPRPEGEAGESDRTARRREARMNMPQPPHHAWTGIRGSPRLLLPTRFGSGPLYDQYGYDSQGRRVGRRGRRQAAAAAEAHAAQAAHAQQATGAVPTGAAPEATQAPAQSRWRPRVSNPFSSMSMPTMRFPGRNRQTNAPAEQTAINTEPSPSQLEAGTTVVR